jgi:hypothetical protein
MSASSKLREKILGISDIKVEQITIPEWDGTVVLVKALSARQRAAYIDAATDRNGKFKADAMYNVVLTNTFDPEGGELLFDPADRDAILDKNAAAVSRIQEKIFALSGLGNEAAEDLGNA